MLKDLLLWATQLWANPVMGKSSYGQIQLWANPVMGKPSYGHIQYCYGPLSYEILIPYFLDAQES
jgi:hypothetical protein